MNLYASLGEQLVHFDVDVAGAALVRRDAVTLPANVQYVWPHPSRQYLYVASSDRAHGDLGQKHGLTVFRISNGGALEQTGAAVTLPYRPIHITVDGSGAWLAATFNIAGAKREPGTVLVYRILQGGASLEPVASQGTIDAGMYPHQALFTRDGHNLLVCTRGNNATNERAEDLGSLKGFHCRNGRLSAAAEVRYEPGLGPRHLDFHPTKPWIYVSMERGNQLFVHRLDDDAKVSPILFARSTLADEGSGKRPRQLAGAIHLNPAGTHVYVLNRADSVVQDGGTEVFAGGENNIAVYRINPETGEPSLVQHADTQGIHPRTFAIDPTGRLLVVGHVLSRRVRSGGAVTTMPMCLSLFRVAPDGRLEFARKYDLDAGNKKLFWMGLV